MTSQLTIPENALQLVEVPAFSALTITTRSTLLTLAEKAMPADLRLRHEVARLGLGTTKPTQWIYTGVNGNEHNEFQIEVALPVDQLAVEPPSDTEFKTFLTSCTTDYSSNFTGMATKTMATCARSIWL